MKKVLSVLLASILIFCSILPCFAVSSGTTYYIDAENGSDLNSGTTSSSAWKTATNLSALSLSAGDSVLFARGGRYECNALTFTCSGTEASPIYISSYGDVSLPKPHLYTDQPTEVLHLYDCCYVTVSDLEITAHNGGGIWIDTFTKTSIGVTLTGLTIHDMQYGDRPYHDLMHLGAAVARACVMVKGLAARSRYPVNDLTIKNCEMYDAGSGIYNWGSWNEEQDIYCNDLSKVDPIYNENTYIDNVYLHDISQDGIVLAICKNGFVTNCRVIDACQDKGIDADGEVVYYTAAMWFWGSRYCTYDHCEVSGQKNVGDGMTVDFDSYSHNCTYQYIYSHDNMSFMKNNSMYDGQRDNCVHHCLSVNDNGGNEIKFSKSAGEYGFRFYNNTIVNCGDIDFTFLHDSLVCNNIFVPKLGSRILYDLNEVFNVDGNTFKNNCYHNCLTPLVDLTSKNTNPGFISDDLSDPKSFMLSERSKLIGKGCSTGADDRFDFFGNSIESDNIGCYSGSGEEDNSSDNFILQLCRKIRALFEAPLNSLR